MTWGIVWTVLVLVALGSLVAVVLRLWQSVADLAHELGNAARLLQRLSDQVEALQAEREGRDPEDDLFADEQRRAELRAVLVPRRAERAARAALRHAAAMERWRRLTR